MSGVMCHVSGVTYQVSCVRCQISGVICQVSQVFYLFFDKVVGLVDGGFVINKAYPVYFIVVNIKFTFVP